jgi:hypothetical protein
VPWSGGSLRGKEVGTKVLGGAFVPRQERDREMERGPVQVGGHGELGGGGTGLGAAVPGGRRAHVAPGREESRGRGVQHDGASGSERGGGTMALLRGLPECEAQRSVAGKG